MKKPFPPTSMWATLACVTALFTFFITSASPFVPLFVLLVLAAHFFPHRFPRDSGSLWGIRLISYAAILFIGQSQSGPEFLQFVRAFTTAGLICGAEMSLEAWREPPPGARFQGVQVLLSGMVWLISVNVPFWRPSLHIWVLSPIYLVLIVFALRDLRPHAPGFHLATTLRQIAAIFLAGALGFAVHTVMWGFRGNLMAMGAQLLAGRVATRNAGVSDAPSLQSSFNVGQSPTRLLRIQGPLTDPHLRAAGFDSYAGGSWGPSISSRPLTPALDAEIKLESPGEKTDITLLADSGGVLYAPLNSRALVPSEGSSFDWARYAGPFKTEDPPPYTYHVIEGSSGKAEYPIEQGPLCIAPNAAQRAELLKISPEIDPKIRQIALQITRGAVSPAAKVAKIVEFLFQNNRYSLEFEKGAGDPVSSFILEKRAGHCQYFGSSAAILLRCVGIPARYATGFYAHESAGPGQTIVRSRDAHAWCEAFLPGIGWVNVEATPPSGRADPRIAPVTPLQRFTEWLQDSFARFRTAVANLTRWQLASIFAVVLLLWLGERWRVGRKNRKNRELPQTLPHELAPLAHRFERVLKRRGIVLPAGQPWSEALAAEEQEQWQAARDWVEIYNRARFSQAQGEVQKLEDQLTDLENRK